MSSWPRVDVILRILRDTTFLQENQLVQVLEKNTELAIQNTDLQKQVQQLQQVGDEIMLTKVA
jgi:hypothetical protein